MSNKQSLFLAALIAMLFAFGCYKENEVPDTDIFTDIDVPDSLIADGVSKAIISVELPNETITAKRAVQFTTTKGLFDVEGKNTISVLASDIYINGEKHVIAKTNLISDNEEGACVVSVKVQNYLRLDTINFIRAFPNSISVAVDKLNYKPDITAELSITVQLKRLTGEGKVSTGQFIKLAVFDRDGQSIGNFRNKTTMIDVDGKCVNTFSIPASLGYNGQIKIVATAANSYSTEISDSTFVNVL
jgi:hypothetical protein